MNIKKTVLLLVLGVQSVCLANQINMSNVRTVEYSTQNNNVGATDRAQEADLDEVDFEIEDNLNSEDIEQLVPLWARLANKIAAPFFVLYNWLQKESDR